MVLADLDDRIIDQNVDPSAALDRLSCYRLGTLGVGDVHRRLRGIIICKFFFSCYLSIVDS